MLCRIQMKQVQNMNAFILCFRSPEALAPLKERGGCSCILCYKNVGNSSGWGCHVFCWCEAHEKLGRGTHRWLMLILTLYTETQLKLSFARSPSETVIHQVHLKCAPTEFRTWGRFTQSFVNSSKPLRELSPNLRFWFRSWEFSFRSFTWSLAISGHHLKSHQTHLRPYGVKTETSMALSRQAFIPLFPYPQQISLDFYWQCFFLLKKEKWKEDISY